MTDAPTTPSPERQPADAGGGLLPCPFCDTTCHVVAWPREFRGRMVAMIECFTDNCYALITADTPADAIAAWNRRASAPPSVQPDARAWLVQEFNHDGVLRSEFAVVGDQPWSGERGADQITTQPLYLSAPAADDGWRPSREEVAKRVYEAMRWAARHAENQPAPEWVEGGNSDAQYQARREADRILALHPAAPTDEVGKS